MISAWTVGRGTGTFVLLAGSVFAMSATRDVTNVVITFADLALWEG